MYGTNPRDSDGDIISIQATDSSSSSMSTESTASTATRLSFDLATARLEGPGVNGSNVALKPHRSSDVAYTAIARRSTAPGLKDFRLIRRIGAGDIGTVFLCRLGSEEDDDGRSSGGGGGGGGGCYYAMKVVDREAVAAKKKVERSETERKILKMLDHPFLPTLYAEFEAHPYSCIVMEYCPGGDLHSLRHRLPLNRFPLSSARFYAAEVLVALEYLHMLGIIYRDLKPENVLVRSDGHIMLSDFDLSLCSHSILSVESPASSPDLTYARPHRSRSLASRIFRSRRVQTLAPAHSQTFVAEPVAARSCSFVGTHEYVAPEVASGRPHGNAVDWWALGVFIYELVYGRTPFAAQSNELTLRNIVKRPLAFPPHPPSSALERHARDLISGLLEKDPARRLGSRRGSADVKTHPFFKGLNFALIRTVKPPEVPGLRRLMTTPCNKDHHQGKRKPSAFDYF